MRRALISVLLLLPASSQAQPQPEPYYPQQQQQPYYPPPQQQYPYYPPPPPPQELPPPRQVDPYTYKPPRMVIVTTSEQAGKDTLTCADALDHRHVDLARLKCSEAIKKDENIAFAHLLLSQAQPPESARIELTRASELGRRSSPGERYFIEAVRSVADGRLTDARRLHDQMVATLPGEPRAFLQRGRFRREMLADLDGAIADLKHAAEMDPKFAAAQAQLAPTLAERGQLDEALAAAKKYLELLPSEPNAHVTLARVHLRRGELGEAVAAARKAVGNDEKFAPARAVLGDALLFSGKGKDARKEYAVLVGTEDPALHHDGAMRLARSWLFEARPGEAEKAIIEESQLAQKTKRPGDQAEALVELARLQLDRGAVTDAGQTLRQARELLGGKEQSAMADEERRRLNAELLQVRAMVLAAIGERQLAEARAEELTMALQVALDPHATERVQALKGWIAARNHDDKSALVDLGAAPRPTLRMALALAIQRSGDVPKARALMEELSKRCDNDLETALTRPRALAWLKATK